MASSAREFLEWGFFRSLPHRTKGRSPMRSVKSFIAAGAATLLSQAALAADMPIAPPPYAPAVVEDFGGWYLRGDIGFSNQSVKDLRYGRESAYSQLTSFQQQSGFDAAGIFGLGVGYRLNNWLRADL